MDLVSSSQCSDSKKQTYKVNYEKGNGGKDVR